MSTSTQHWNPVHTSSIAHVIGDVNEGVPMSDVHSEK